MDSLAAFTYNRSIIVWFHFKDPRLVTHKNKRAQNCKQNVFTQWHIFIYLLNNYSVGRNNVTACTESILSCRYQPVWEQYLFLYESLGFKRCEEGIALYWLMETTAKLIKLKRDDSSWGTRRKDEKKLLQFGFFYCFSSPSSSFFCLTKSQWMNKLITRSQIYFCGC